MIKVLSIMQLFQITKKYIRIPALNLQDCYEGTNGWRPCKSLIARFYKLLIVWFMLIIFIKANCNNVAVINMKPIYLNKHPFSCASCAYYILLRRKSSLKVRFKIGMTDIFKEKVKVIQIHMVKFNVTI